MTVCLCNQIAVRFGPSARSRQNVDGPRKSEAVQQRRRHNTTSGPLTPLLSLTLAVYHPILHLLGPRGVSISPAYWSILLSTPLDSPLCCRSLFGILYSAC